MKKFITLFLVILQVPILSFSQNTLKITEKDSTVLITASQLKETNLIFAEHSKLLKDNSLLKEQISNYQIRDSLFIKADSLKSLQLKNYEDLSNSYSIQINSLNKELRNKDRTILKWKIGSVVISTGLVLWLLIK